MPTLPGVVLLLAALALLAFASLRLAYPWLAAQHPAAGARILVVEGWLADRELEQAVTAIRAGNYDRVVTTGGPIERWTEMLGATSHADFAAGYLLRSGVPRDKLTSLPAAASDRDRSYASAVKVRQWIIAEGQRPAAIDIMSSGAHARRSAMVFRLALGPGIDVGVLVARPVGFDPERWWTNSEGVKAVVGELLSVAWTSCCFFPDAPPAAR